MYNQKKYKLSSQFKNRLLDFFKFSRKNRLFKKSFFYGFILFCFLTILSQLTSFTACTSVYSNSLKCHKKSKCLTIALEGMPGAGKTSTIFRLIPGLEGICIILPELNAEPGSELNSLSISKQGEKFHQWWDSRMKILKELSPYTNCFLLDRTYFTNLAYSYAFDKFLDQKKYASSVENKERYDKESSETSKYEFQKKLFKQDLEDKPLDLIIILDVSPEEGLRRRHSVHDHIPWPWSERIFLSFLQEFYYKELPKYTQAKIVYIKTDNKPFFKIEKEIKSLLENYLNKKIPEKSLKSTNLKDENKILGFSEEHKLGKLRSPLVSVFGYPTIYFKKQSVQLVNGTPKFLNNTQLSFIAHKFNEISCQKNILNNPQIWRESW